ncbi:hypothetical protein V8Z74_19690 [Comamonas sp. w2-DMI]|uniref:hypothetical protein n=1 Tax=Comamonas sp. w2-DMI TaxID=3126391 RepID=UPI0032E39071
MATRRPLVRVGGRTRQLPAGDKLPVTRSLLGQWSGESSASAGGQRFYPPAALSITQITAWMTGAAGAATGAVLRINGQAKASIDIPAGQTLASKPLAITTAAGDYLTLDRSGAAATAFAVRIDYLES